MKFGLHSDAAMGSFDKNFTFFTVRIPRSIDPFYRILGPMN